MNIQKAEVKIALTQEFGKQFDERKQEAEKEQWAAMGEVRALKKAAKKVAELMIHVDRDLKEGKIDQEMAEPHLVARYAKRQYQHAVGAIDNLATQAEIMGHRAAGVEIGFRRSAEMLQRMYQAEVEKLQALQQAINDGKVQMVGGELVFSDENDGDGRPLPGGHPGLSLKDQRQLEEEKEGEEKAEAKEEPKKAKGKGRSKSATKAAASKGSLSLVKSKNGEDKPLELPNHTKP